MGMGIIFGGIARARKGDSVRVGKRWVRKPRPAQGAAPLEREANDGRVVKATQLSNGKIAPEKRSLR